MIIIYRHFTLYKYGIYYYELSMDFVEAQILVHSTVMTPTGTFDKDKLISKEWP